MDETATLRLLVREVGKILNVANVDPDRGIAEIGIDSLNIVELMLCFEELYEQPFQPEELSLDQFTTLRQLDQQILQMRTFAAACRTETTE